VNAEQQGRILKKKKGKKNKLPKASKLPKGASLSGKGKGSVTSQPSEEAPSEVLSAAPTAGPTAGPTATPDVCGPAFQEATECGGVYACPDSCPNFFQCCEDIFWNSASASCDAWLTYINDGSNGCLP
jgi:hypothetical protein